MNITASSLDLHAGELVEVRAKEEILRTLDRNGQLEGLPFMPQMFQYCGRQFRVYKRAHKTCDTVFPVRSRRMSNAVHLETRCDGSAHGGCQAACLIFWKEAWLKRAGQAKGESSIPIDATIAGMAGCAEEDVWRGTKAATPGTDEDPVYVCQATRLPYYTTDLKPSDFSQYIEDYRSGNVSISNMISVFIYAAYRNLINSGIGLGTPLRWLYDKIQALRGGIPYPRKQGAIALGEKTPELKLDLQPGELVRVKSYNEILKTIDQRNFNRGLFFDAEMVPYCGKTFRVLKRVDQILNEKTGKMMRFKNACIILENVVCQSCYSDKRYFCPRAIYPYWREIWLERVNQTKNQPSSETLHAEMCVSG